MLLVDGTTPQSDGPSGSPPWISLGDFTIVQNMVDEFGVRWELNELNGWFTPATATGDVDQRANDHGGWPRPGHYGPRSIELRCSAHASSWRAVEAALGRVFAALPVSTLTPLVVSIDGEESQAMVRQRDEPELDPHNYLKRAYFTLLLTAPDPRRYSTTVTSVETGLPVTTGGLSLPLSLPLSIGANVDSGVLTAVNDGNIPTRPTLTVFGPVPPGSVTHRGTAQTLRWHEDIPAGRHLLIDTAKRRALLDGTAARRVTGSWFEYAKGSNEVAFAAATYNPDARLLSEHRSARR